MSNFSADRNFNVKRFNSGRYFSVTLLDKVNKICLSKGLNIGKLIFDNDYFMNLKNMKTVIKENTDGMVNSLHVLLKRKQKILAIIKIL